MDLKQLTIENISEFIFEDLQKPEASAAVDKLIAEILDGREVSEARDVLRVMEPLVKKLPSENSRQHYTEVLRPLKLMSLAFQTPKEISFYLKHHALEAIKRDLNFTVQIELTFSVTADDFTGGALRQQMIRALQENEERLGHRELELINEDKKMQPYIRYWLKDYEGRFSGQEARTEYHVSRYLNESPNVRQLKEEERAWLVELLGVYDFLRFYVVRTSEVRELEKLVERETNDNLSVRTGTDRSASVQSESVYGEMSGPKLSGAEILAAYRGNDTEEQAINEELQGLRHNLTSAKERADYLWQLLQATSNEAEMRRKVSATLRLLAEQGELTGLLSKDRRLREVVTRYAETDLGKETSAEIKAEPRSVAAVAALIRFALEGQFGLGATESARQGVKIGNILKQRGETEYQGMAFFDAKDKRFTWSG